MSRVDCGECPYPTFDCEAGHCMKSVPKPPKELPLRERVLKHIEERLAKNKTKKDKQVFLSDEAWALIVSLLKEWRTIDSAPRDGTHIVITDRDDKTGFGWPNGVHQPWCAVVHWFDDGWYLSTGGSAEIDDIPRKATHWRPL